MVDTIRSRLVTWASWIALVSVLIISLFGFSFHLKLIAFLFSFLCGIAGVSYMYFDKNSILPEDIDYFDNPLEETNFSIQLPRVLDIFESNKAPPKFDQRITGSETVDSFLNEIVDIVIADYLSPWYEMVTADEELKKYSLKQTIQQTGANLSNRVKAVDWVQLLATKFPEEVTTHLKLFKQARVRMKHIASLAEKEGASPKKEDPDRKTHRRNKSDTDVGWFSNSLPPQMCGKSKFYASTENLSGKTLKDIFFDLECMMEDRKICRDIFCTDSDKEYALLCEVSEAILYLIAPVDAWQCTSLKLILIELLASVILKPLLNMLSDPDNINLFILRMCCKDTSLPSELLLYVIRCCEDLDELNASLQLVKKQVQILHSRDSGGECELPVRQQLSSLQFLQRVIQTRRAALEPYKLTDEADSGSHDKVDAAVQNSLQFLGACSEWRSNAQYLVEMEVNDTEASSQPSEVLENLRSSALELCDLYLGAGRPPLLGVADDAYSALVRKITADEEEFAGNPVACFDELQKAIFDALEDTQEWQSSQSTETDNYGLSNSGNDLSKNDYLRNKKRDKVERKHSADILATPQLYARHNRSRSDIVGATQLNVTSNLKSSTNVSLSQSNIDNTSEKAAISHLQASIIETALVQDKGKTFGIYAIAVKRLSDGEEWHIYRRYSDFYDLQSNVKDRWPELSSLPFPSKKTFSNTSRAVLERRKAMLDAYLQSLAALARQARYEPLLSHAYLGGFLSRQTTGRQSSSIDALLVNSLKAGMRTLKSVPDQLASTVDGVMDGISKVFQGKSEESFKEDMKIPHLPQQETDESAALSLLEEALGLRGLWLRRHLLAAVRTLLADHINKKVLEYVSTITSPWNIVQYLKYLKQLLVNRIGMEHNTRDAATKAKTRIAAKMALLAACSDELRHIVGIDTARRGLLTMFQLVQTQDINKRLIWVLLEATLSNMFPDNHIREMFRRMYTNSSRVHSSAKKQNTL